MKPSYAAAFFAITALTVVHGAVRNAETAASVTRTLFDQCQTTIAGLDGKPQVIYQRCLPGQGSNNPNTAGPRVTGIPDPTYLQRMLDEAARSRYKASGPTGCSQSSSQYDYQRCMVGKNLYDAGKAAKTKAYLDAHNAAMAATRAYRAPQQTPEQLAAFRVAQEATQAAQSAANTTWGGGGSVININFLCTKKNFPSRGLCERNGCDWDDIRGCHQ